MSNETDLDWLARNVHKWPAGDHQPWCYVYMAHGGVMKAAGNFLDAVAYPIRITIDQWLSRRAELQNKPNWGSVGSEVNFISQHEDGQWIGHSEKPEEGDECFECDCIISLFGYGEVLGDWRDTLEKRPADLSEQAVTARLKEATDNVLAAAPGLMTDKYKFEPFVSVEDSKEQDMKQDNGWFERGELPPVGTVCLYAVSDRLSAEVEITAHAKFGLCFVEVGKSGENYVSKTAELHLFLPIRTERELAIDRMQFDIAERWANCEEMARHLVDKGWVKAGK